MTTTFYLGSFVWYGRIVLEYAITFLKFGIFICIIIFPFGIYDVRRSFRVGELYNVVTPQRSVRLL